MTENVSTEALRQRVAGTNVQHRQEPVTLQQQLDRMMPEFQKAMPRGVEATMLVRDVASMIRQQPGLATCDPMSVIGGAMTFAQLGLRPGIPALGHGWLLPMKDWKRGMLAQFILGYQGMIELAHRSEKVGVVRAHIVYEADEFDVVEGLHADLVHKPARVPLADRGASVAYYAVVQSTNGTAAFQWAMRDEMEAHRDKYAMAKKRDGTIVGPWASEFDAMARKTMVRRLFRYMPKSTELQNGMAADETVRLDVDPRADLLTAGESLALDAPTGDEGEHGEQGSD